MKITEKLLLDNLTGITTTGCPISDLPDGTRIWWEYRTGLDCEGYNPVCFRERASEITLENNRFGTIPVDAENGHHPSVQQLQHWLDSLYGTST